MTEENVGDQQVGVGELPDVPVSLPVLRLPAEALPVGDPAAAGHAGSGALSPSDAGEMGAADTSSGSRARSDIAGGSAEEKTEISRNFSALEHLLIRAERMTGECLAASRELAEALSAVGGRIAEIERIGRKNADFVDRLLADNQVLRVGELVQAQLPLLRDLMGLHDKIEKIESAPGATSGTDLALIRLQLLEVLARAGLEPLAVAAGDAFDPAAHNASGRSETPDAALAGTVAKVLGAGFARSGAGGALVRPASVAVFVHVPSGMPDEPAREGDAPATVPGVLGQADSRGCEAQDVAASPPGDPAPASGQAAEVADVPSPDSVLDQEI